MQLSTLVLLLAFVALGALYAGRQRARDLARAAGGVRALDSLPVYYGLYAALWALAPSLPLLLAWLALDERLLHALVLAGLPDELVPADAVGRGLLIGQLENAARGAVNAELLHPALAEAAGRLAAWERLARQAMAAVVLGAAALGAGAALVRLSPALRARRAVERALVWSLLGCASVAVLTTLGIVASVLFEALRFFDRVPFTEFVFGLEWSPQTAIRADQVGASGSFGAVPLFVGTLLISAIAMLVAVPVGLLSAVYLAEYAAPRLRAAVKPILEVLAGVPTVVYGFFAALTVAPWLRDLGSSLGLAVSSESALAAGLVMGVMIIPFVSSLADDVITAVPRALRDGSLALGATPSETVARVVFPAALPGIVGGVLLAVSRAVGETMIVVMAAGLAANLTLNPLESVTTVTVQIVTLLVGDQEFDSAKTLAAFALGLMLFLTTLVLNVVALTVVRRYRERYE
ncbi:MAG: phosphate transport system permease protein [Porticoccaceae bacterium]|nr:MAG: phosphate transport system permease protein [Porticoccaceae bacterium]